MPQIRPLVFLLLASFAFGEDQPNGEDRKKEAIGLRRLLAYVQQSGQENEIVVEGEGNLPDNTVIDVSVEHRGQPCETLRGSVSPKGGIFSMRLSTPKSFLPGYYVVVAQVGPWRQTGELAEIVEKIGEIRVTQAITVGTPEEIKASRDQQLKLYEDQIVEMEGEFAKVSKIYAKVVQIANDGASMAAWKAESGPLRDEWTTKAQELNERFQDSVIPIFPLLHSWTVNGWMNLVKIHQSMENGLSVDLAALAGHGETRAVFLKLANEEFTGYVRGIRAQVLLERHLEVRDRILNVLSQLSSLFGESQSTYRQARDIQTEEIKVFWKQIDGEWNKRLADIESTLPQIKAKELQESFPDILASILETPSALRKLWRLYSQIVVEGAKTLKLPGHERESFDKQLESAELECHSRIYPLMEVLGFNREVFNRQMNRTAEVSESAEPLQLLSGTLDEYILGQTEKLASDDEAVRNQALQVILSMKAGSLRVLKKRLDAGVEPGSRMEALLLICLGRLGDASVAARLLQIVQSSTDESIRMSATLAVGSTRSVEGLMPLTQLLKEDKSASVRGAAATALSFLGKPSALDGLIDAFMDGDASVRQSALAAAEALAKTDFQYDPKAPQGTRKSQTDAARTWLEQNRSSLEAGGK